MSITNNHGERLTYTVEEVAHLLGISRTTAYQSVRSGEIPSCRFGRRLVVPVRAVDELLEGAGQGSRRTQVRSEDPASARREPGRPDGSCQAEA